MSKRDHAEAPKRLIKDVRDLMSKLPAPFKDASDSQIKEYAGRLFELRIDYKSKEEQKAVAKSPDKPRQKIAQDMEALVKGAERAAKFLTPKTRKPEDTGADSPHYALMPAVEEALIKAANEWAARFEAEQTKLDEDVAKRNRKAREQGDGARLRRDRQLLPPGFELPPGFARPSMSPDGSIDYGAAGFVRQYFLMARAMAEIMPEAKRLVAQKPDEGAEGEANAISQVVGGRLPEIIEQIFGVKVAVHTGSAVSNKRSRNDLLTERPGYSIIEPSLRLIAVWKPRDGEGKRWKVDTLAAYAKRYAAAVKEPVIP